MQQWKDPHLQAKIGAVCLSITARVGGVAISLMALFQVISKTPHRIRKVITIAVQEPSFKGFLRACFATALCVAVVSLRILVSLAGVVVPEVVFNKWHAERLLLYLGLLYRVQHASLPETYREQLPDQRWRHRFANRAMHLIDEHLEDLSRQSRVALLTQALEEAITEDELYEVSLRERSIVRRQQPTSVDVSYRRNLILHVNEVVKKFRQEKLYTVEEFQEEETATLLAVMQCAVFYMIDSWISLSPDGKLSFTAGNGKQQVLPQTPKTEKMRQLKLHILSVKERDSKPETLNKILPFYPYFLCVDPERVKKAKITLPEETKEIKQFVSQLIGFSNEYVMNSLGPMSKDLQKAFACEGTA